VSLKHGGSSVTVLASEPVLSIVIPVRNEGGRLKAAVTSITAGRSERFPLQIVLVDDNSSDGCCAGIAEMFSWRRDQVRVDVIRLRHWSGIPFARNAGAGAATAGTLFITDANVLFPPNWDVPVRQNLCKDRVLCATIGDMASSFRGYGCTLRIPSMGVSWIRDPAQFGGYVPIASCAATILPAELFHRAGGYDTAMPAYGAAEPEFSVRLWLSGAEIVSVPNLVLQHRFRPDRERRPFLAAIASIQLYNYLRFGMLYLDQPRVNQMMRYYMRESPAMLEAAVRGLKSSDVWHRRRLLEQRLPLKFQSYVDRFDLRDAHGQLAYC